MKATGRKLVASLSALLLCAAPGLGPSRAFGQVVAASVRGAAVPVAPVLPAGSFGAPAVGQSPSLASAVLPGAPSLLVAPTPVLSLPAQFPAAARAVALSAPASAVRAVSATPGAAALSAAAPAVAPTHGRARAWSEPAHAAAPAVRGALEAAQEGLEESQKPGSALRAADVSAALFDGAKRPSSASPVAEPASDRRGRASRSGLRPSLGRAAAGTAVVAAGVAGLRIAPFLSIPTAGAWSRVVEFSGRAGYLVGNALAFVFAIPQIHKTFKDGGAKGTPVWRAVVGATASLSLGLISAPLAGQWFWGVQNIFGGLTLLAPLLLSPLLARRGGGFSAKASAGLTAVTSTAIFLPSMGLYAAAVRTVPALLRSLLGAAGIAHLALGLQIATGAMFFLLFAPDVIDIVKGRTPKGFTSLFSLLFFAASVGFVAWTAQMASAAPAGSSERAQFIVYALQNAAYAVVSFLSWLYIRRAERAPARDLP